MELSTIMVSALVGAQVSDHVFLLMTDQAVEMMFASNGSVQLGRFIFLASPPPFRTIISHNSSLCTILLVLYYYRSRRWSCRRTTGKNRRSRPRGLTRQLGPNLYLFSKQRIICWCFSRREGDRDPTPSE